MSQPRIDPNGRLHRRTGVGRFSVECGAERSGPVNVSLSPLTPLGRYALSRAPYCGVRTSQTRGVPMIFGAHVIVFTHDAEADRAFFRDVLGHVERRLRRRVADLRDAALRDRVPPDRREPDQRDLSPLRRPRRRDATAGSQGRGLQPRRRRALGHGHALHAAGRHDDRALSAQAPDGATRASDVAAIVPWTRRSSSLVD